MNFSRSHRRLSVSIQRKLVLVASAVSSTCSSYVLILLKRSAYTALSQDDSPAPSQSRVKGVMGIKPCAVEVETSRSYTIQDRLVWLVAPVLGTGRGFSHPGKNVFLPWAGSPKDRCQRNSTYSLICIESGQRELLPKKAYSFGSFQQ